MTDLDQLVSIISESCPKHSSAVNAKQRISTVRTRVVLVKLEGPLS
jgi:hypothetical protein